MAACDFNTYSPGRVKEEDLNAESSVKPLVTGMSSDFSEEYDGIAFLIGRASDEMAGSGSYSDTRLYRVGDIAYNYVDAVWEGISRARWVAEDGLRRMQEDIPDYQFEGNVLTARAYLYAGLSNRVLGESYCDPVYDGGPPQDATVAFQRAVGHFTEAIDNAQQAGASDIETAAYGGRAQAYVGLEDWTNAVVDAGQVPTNFVFNALYHTTSGREENEVYIETHERHEMSAYNTYIASLDPTDPRTPFTDCTVPDACPNAQGADGSTPHYRQEKYQGVDDDIPAIKGTEMRLIEAEARLVQASDVPGAIARINDVREFFSLDPIDPTGMNLQDAWITLDHERMLTLWLEGRRLYDMRRWDAAGLDFLPAVQFIYGGTIVYPGDNPRDVCIPISQSECLVNTNVQNTEACAH